MHTMAGWGRGEAAKSLGKQFIGQHREKATVHRLAHTYQQAASWGAIRPGPEVD